MSDIKFIDNSIKVNRAIEDAIALFLEEASGEIESSAKRNSRVDTGQLKNSWTHIVDESAGEAVIGSPLENAIWEEFGTGEYAVNGDGRKGGWFYKDAKGEGHFTHGKKPNRTLERAFTANKSKIKARAESIFKRLDK